MFFETKGKGEPDPGREKKEEFHRLSKKLEGVAQCGRRKKGGRNKNSPEL